MFVATIRVVSRADVFLTKGRMFQGVGMSLIGPGCELKLCGISISIIGAKLSEVVRGIWPGA